MTKKDFDLKVKETFDKCFELVTAKGKFYGIAKDRLGQIKKIAILNNETPMQAAYGLVSKHFVALGEMIDHSDKFSEEEFDAYILDVAIYMAIIRNLKMEE